MGIAPAFGRLGQAVSLPVLAKEMRSRMRGKRGPILLLLTASISSIVAILVVAPQWNFGASSPAEALNAMGRIGAALFVVLTILQGVFCLTITPAFTSGAIAAERERQTLEMLILTRLSPANIVLGKLLSDLSFVFMVLFCTLPITGICFMLGGVSPGQVGWSFVLLITTVCAMGALGVYCSVLSRTARSAAVAALVFSIAWLFIVPLGLVSLEASFYSYSPKGLRWDNVVPVILLTAMLASYPATLVSVLLSRFLRQGRLLNLGIWLCVSAVLAALALSHPRETQQFVSRHMEQAYVFSPPLMLGQLLSDPEYTMSSVAVSPWLLATTAAIQLLGAWVFVVLAAGMLKRLRF